MKIRFPRNLAGILGIALAGASLVSFAFLLLVELGRGAPGPYVGLFHYIALPLLVVAGAGLYGVGVWLERRAARRGVTPRTILLDLSRSVRTQQALMLMVGGVGSALVFLLSFGGVRAVEYSESEAFCGDVCHTVMEPEYTAWQHTSHARVECVECHVGSGAASFVQAKVRGIRQVVAVATGNFPRPIPTPIDIRDTDVTCEGCHWSTQNHGSIPLNHEYYLTEGFDEPWVIDMSIKIGGGDRETGFSDGAHWHMNLDAAIEYVALDERRQEIAWVRFTDGAGETTEFLNAELDFDRAVLESAPRLGVDCLTCHNRPAHRFPTPVDALNDAFRVGTLDPGVPGIRWLGLEALAAEYSDRDEARAAIATTLDEGFADEDPEWYAANAELVQESIASIQRIFGRIRFPEMGVLWTAYPDNSQHWSSPGCFRCHAGNMVSESGATISSTCNTCHLIRGQGRRNGWEFAPGGLRFVHPADGEVMDEPILCHECHDGALGY